MEAIKNPRWEDFHMDLYGEAKKNRFAYLGDGFTLRERKGGSIGATQTLVWSEEFIEGKESKTNDVLGFRRILQPHGLAGYPWMRTRLFASSGSAIFQAFFGFEIMLIRRYNGGR